MGWMGSCRAKTAANNEWRMVFMEGSALALPKFLTHQEQLNDHPPQGATLPNSSLLHPAPSTSHLLFCACQQPADDGTEQGSPDGACCYASTAATFPRCKRDNLLQCQTN